MCENELNWRSPADPDKGSADADSWEDSDVRADMTAVGKDIDGTVRFEAVCTCPECRTRNKYFISAKMI